MEPIGSLLWSQEPASGPYPKPLINYAENRPWEAESCRVFQESYCHSWDPVIHYCCHDSPPLVPILSHMNQAYISKVYFFKIQFNIIFPFRTCTDMRKHRYMQIWNMYSKVSFAGNQSRSWSVTVYKDANKQITPSKLPNTTLCVKPWTLSWRS
jgi:hypothetical protein